MDASSEWGRLLYSLLFGDERAMKAEEAARRYAENFAVGEENARREAAYRMLSKGKFEDAFIAEMTELSLDDVLTLKTLMGKV